MTWNLQSGDASITTLASAVAREQGVAAWALSEVDPSWLSQLRRAAAEGEQGRFQAVLGSTGGRDRLAVLFDSDALRLVAHEELHAINIRGAVRAPLVARLEHRTSGVEFILVVNHLYRSKPRARLKQSRLLAQWASRQELPVIMAGDFNYDWHFERGDHGPGYDALTAGGGLVWVRPPKLVPTQCSRHGSVLDFFFVDRAALAWKPRARILFPERAYCDYSFKDTRSDHRPVELRIEVPIASK